MSKLLAQLRSAREFSVEVVTGRPEKRVRFLRPPAAQMPRFRAGVTAELLVEYAQGWDAITDGDILPPGIGGDSPALFSPELLFELLEDNTRWREACAKGMVDAISAWLERQEQVAKN